MDKADAKIGDLVACFSIPTNRDSIPGFSILMEYYVGQVGTVDGLFGEDCSVAYPDGAVWYYRYEWLTPVGVMTIDPITTPLESDKPDPPRKWRFRDFRMA